MLDWMLVACQPFYRNLFATQTQSVDPGTSNDLCACECILLSKISSRTRFLDFSDLTPSVAFSRYNVDIPVSHIHECFQEDDRLIVIVESLSVNCSRIGSNRGAVGRSSRSVNGELCLIPGG